MRLKTRLERLNMQKWNWKWGWNMQKLDLEHAKMKLKARLEHAKMKLKARLEHAKMRFGTCKNEIESKAGTCKNEIESKAGTCKNGNTTSLLTTWPTMTKLIRNDSRSVLCPILSITWWPAASHLGFIFFIVSHFNIMKTDTISACWVILVVLIIC